MNTNWKWAIWSLLLCCLPTMAQEPAQQYLIESYIIAIPADVGRECLVKGGEGEFTLRGNGNGVNAFSEIKSLECAGMTLTLAEDGLGGKLLWNGELNPPEDSVIELISAPRVGTLAGQKASITSGSTLQYFSREEDGCYKLRFSIPDESPGLVLSYTPEPAGCDADSRLVDVYMTMTLRALEGREKLKGTGLDVGRPIIGIYQTATTLKLALDQWHLASGHQATTCAGEEGDFLLVLLRVRDAKDLDLPQAPPPAKPAIHLR